VIGSFCMFILVPPNDTVDNLIRIIDAIQD